MGRLDGKVCLVTGAGSGIGAKTAELFAQEGASVIMADMQEENLNKVAESIRAAAEVWGPTHPRRPAYREHIIGQFTGSSYGWMWPFRAHLERWYDRVLATIDQTR